MVPTDIPFNLKLLATDKRPIMGLLPVQSTDIYITGGKFHPQGLYSVEIFGALGTPERQIKDSYVDMRADVMHPKVFMELSKLKNLYGDLMSGAAHAIWDDKEKDFVKSNIIDGKTGYSFFMSKFNEIFYQSNDSDIRELRITFLNKVNDKCMYRYLMVIPAGLREIENDDTGRTVEDDINKLYRQIIRITNTISIYDHDKVSPALDTARWSLQKKFNELYEYLQTVLTGKYGFLLSKWAARNIHGGTRNVITAMDPSPRELGAADAVSVDDTMCGLHQYLKATSDLSIYNIKTGPMQSTIDVLPNDIFVVDPRTYKAKLITPSTHTIDLWGSGSGIEKIVNGFAKLDARHKPIYIDGNYAALIYKDGKNFKVFKDISELPLHKNKEHVTPLTCGELLYISVYQQSKKMVGYATRYPISGLGSIYPSKIYLTSTVKYEALEELDNSWQPMGKEYVFHTFPITNVPWIDSMSVHNTKLEGLGADFDGDLNTVCVG